MLELICAMGDENISIFRFGFEEMANLFYGSHTMTLQGAHWHRVSLEAAQLLGSMAQEINHVHFFTEPAS
ncbi:hypothetical protein J7400_10925 [Shimia sp. R9_2]|uniref:hypothetical protein n=1 Tax=Shimia sp. R9_2 TaxID=2821112 RepID=UPI001AD9ECE0|nr:hypothetical protein [Shimia sp. R9_2]MBO9397194.1 hypothetical protein [Shimia sp. R9_2]